MVADINDIIMLLSSLSPKRLIPFCHACPLINSSRAKKLFLLGFGFGDDGKVMVTSSEQAGTDLTHWGCGSIPEIT